MRKSFALDLCLGAFLFRLGCRKWLLMFILAILFFSPASCTVDLCYYIYGLPLLFRLSSDLVQLPFNVQ